jgi:DNA-directed RNA polymerase subunit RPC12/RpoP
MSSQPWQPTPVGECLACGAQITSQFARVCGDNQNNVHACPQCSSTTAVINGAAAKGGDAR